MGLDNLTQTDSGSKFISATERAHDARAQKRILNQIVIFMLRGLRPLLGTVSCKYPVSCGTYAQLQLEHTHLLRACYLIIKRIASCNPLC